MDKSLAPQTAAIFDSITRMESIKPYVLVGGTALSLQLGTRQSEDLDFMSWRTSKNEKREVDWPKIQKELEGISAVESVDVLDLDHVEFRVAGVKLSFYASPNYSPTGPAAMVSINNMRLAPPAAIGAMKMEVMLRRSKFRDYYDIYSLLRAGYGLQEMIDGALRYSGHRLKSKNLIAMLTRSERFCADSNFRSLAPVYDVSAAEIERYIISLLGR